MNKLEEFEAELKHPATPAAERLLAFKFLIHFAGDLHQPLHASDHEDRGGNCIGLSDTPDGARNLHVWRDAGVFESLGSSPEAIAAGLERRITPEDIRHWGKGDPRTWAMETFQIAKASAYAFTSSPTCEQHGPIVLSAAYKFRSEQVAAEHLEKAGVKMALLIDRALS